MMYKMVLRSEVDAFHRYIAATPPDRLPCPANWPPRRNPSGAFDSNTPWARFRRDGYRYGHDQGARVYPGESATGAGLLAKIVAGMKEAGGTIELSTDEVAELEAALMPEQAGDETASATERLRAIHKPDGESVEPSARDQVASFLRGKNVSEDDIGEVLKRFDNDLPKPGTEGGAGGRFASSTRWRATRRCAG
jgi:hypothetical protein